jgi:hypothetical protein
MKFIKVNDLSEITEPGNYEFGQHRFTLEHYAEDHCGLLGWNLTGHWSRNGHATQIYCGVNGGNIVYQCKKLKTILNHVKNLSTFYI